MNRYRMNKGRLPLGPIFGAGILSGILMMSLGKHILLENTGLLDENALYHMKYMTIDSSKFFYYILRIRLESTIILAVLATTYLGLIVCAGTTFWYGLSAGSFLTAVVMRYGLRGILFAAAGVLPQYILYVPAGMALLVWCEKLNRSIYFRNGPSDEAEKGTIWAKRVLQLAGIVCVLVMGCLLESFINPKILGKILNVF